MTRAHRRMRVLHLSALLVAAMLVLGAPVAARAADPWLFVNDVHLSPSDTDRRPSSFGVDTNPALLTSALAEMRRVAPNPPVIVMDGDFLDHSKHSTDAVPTFVLLARRFNAAFPHAQFVLALGNEDSSCGDYAVAPDSPFLHAVATAWAPLVNRNGVAPDFVRSFSHDGSYRARLPIAGVTAVVIDDAFWSPFYRGACGHGDPTIQTLAAFNAALAPVKTERRWLVMHIPPGIDAFSTVRKARHLAIVPFMLPDPRDAILNLVSDPSRRVELVVTAHAHRFSYRIIDPTGSAPVPVLMSPAISPIFDNNPSFLTADVARDGHIRNLEEHSRVRGTWRDVGGLGTLGVSQFSGPALVDLQRRLERDPALREKFSRLYLGGTRWREINERNWRSYWCVATAFTSNTYRDCVDEGGFSFLTRRGIVVVGVAAAVGLVIVGALVGFIVYGLCRRRRRLSG